jgi:hypothetical protein
MNTEASPQRSIAPVHWLFFATILVDGVVMACVPFFATGWGLRTALLGWGLFLFGVQVAWVLALVSDAERDGVAGILSRGRAAFGMAVGCLLTPLWTGWLLAHLARARAVRLAPESAAHAHWRELASNADKLLFAAALWLVLQLFLNERMAGESDANLEVLEAFLMDSPSLAESLGTLNAALVSSFGLLFALYTWRVAVRGVRALAEPPRHEECR